MVPLVEEAVASVRTFFSLLRTKKSPLPLICRLRVCARPCTLLAKRKKKNCNLDKWKVESSMSTTGRCSAFTHAKDVQLALA